MDRQNVPTSGTEDTRNRRCGGLAELGPELRRLGKSPTRARERENKNLDRNVLSNRDSARNSKENWTEWSNPPGPPRPSPRT